MRQKFTLKERDNETGLDYFLARYYLSTQGRFTSPDEFKGGPEELFDFAEDAAENPTFYAELDIPQSLNKYQYTYNSPLRYTDPTGHCVGVLTPFRPLCIKAAQKIAERSTPYVAVVVGALSAAASEANRNNTVADPSCPSCGRSFDFGQSLMKRNEKRQQSQQQNQEGQSSNYQPNPKHDGPKKDDRREVSPQPQAGGSLFDSAVQVKQGQRVAVDHSSGKFVVYRTDPNGQTHGYETNWKGLRNDQRAALQKAGLVTKHGRITPQENQE